MESMTQPEGGLHAGRSGEPAPLAGRLVLPPDGEYDLARKAWNLTVDQHPAAIVYPNNAADVVQALTFARERGLGVAVQCTGHGVIQPADGALLIQTSAMHDLQVDPDRQTARIGAGVKWGEVLEQTQLHGLAPLLGSSPDVGAVGYSLGGGMGWLARKYGMNADSILEFDLVTPDGAIRRASPDENADLFWALCGGGGGFGVVTSMTVRLYPVAQVYAGNLYYPLERVEEAFQRFRAWADEAPVELTPAIAIMNYPAFPQIPDPLRGKSFVIVRGCFCGPTEAGEKLLAYWRDWQTPILDGFKTIPFSQAASISQDPVNPTASISTGAWLADLSDEAAEVLARYSTPQDGFARLVATEIRLAGGAITHPDPDANAYSHRDSRWMWSSVGPAGTPEMARQLEQHLEGMFAELGPHLSGKLYMNLIDGKRSRLRTRDGFSEKTYRRLQAIKAQVDPDNRFRYSYDISPALE